MRMARLQWTFSPNETVSEQVRNPRVVSELGRQPDGHDTTQQNALPWHDLTLARANSMSPTLQHPEELLTVV